MQSHRVSLCAAHSKIFVVLLIAAQVYEELEVGGAFDNGSISRSNLFLSVHDATLFAQQTSAERGVSTKVGPPSASKIPYHGNPCM